MNLTLTTIYEAKTIMKISKYLIYPALLFSLFLAACSTVPLTGRKQLSIVPSSQMQSMSYQQYSDFMKTHKAITGTPEAQMVTRVGSRIQQAVEKYFAQNNLSDQLKGYAWEFNLVDDPQVNAWCMPGGKVVVYSGIMKLVKNEAELATVLGHEISHAVARHGDERMSQELVTQLGGMALQEAIKSKPALTQNIYMAAFGLGSQVGVLLPFSRTHESEADRLGLIFMAMAGYDPNAAVGFWESMAAQSKGAPPEFLSTHPSDQTRINDIKKEIPEAMKYYNK
ncbi:MAG: M48 family metallopeptidase [Syntrophothermus sp.]